MRRWLFIVIYALLLNCPLISDGADVQPQTSGTVASLLDCTIANSVLQGGTTPTCTPTPVLNSLGIGGATTLGPKLFVLTGFQMGSDVASADVQSPLISLRHTYLTAPVDTNRVGAYYAQIISKPADSAAGKIDTAFVVHMNTDTTSTSAWAGLAGGRMTATHDGAGLISQLYGAQFNAFLNTGTATEVWGANPYVSTSSGTTASIVDITRVHSTLAGTVTTATGLNIYDFGGAGAITTGYGLRIQTAVARATTTWGLYIDAAAAYFGGPLTGASNVIEQRNSTNAQALRIYNTYTNGSTYERGNIYWTSNVFRIETAHASGTNRNMQFVPGGTNGWNLEADTGILFPNHSNGYDIGKAANPVKVLYAINPIVQGHIQSSTTTPSVSNTSANSCGTTAATIVGTDIAGKVTVGATAGTSCTITFTTAYTNAPACAVTNETTANLLRATSTTTTVVVAGTMVAGDVLAYMCLGRL